MAKATFVKKAQKDIPDTDIKKGDSYYWWKFRFGGKHVSKTAPRRSQLTQSGFLSSLYDLEDNTIGNLSAEDLSDLQAQRDEIVSEIENLKDEAQSSLDNMPEQLQESSQLNDRISSLEDWQSEIESIDIPDEVEEGEELEDVIQGIIEEIQQTGYSGE